MGQSDPTSTIVPELLRLEKLSDRADEIGALTREVLGAHAEARSRLGSMERRYQELFDRPNDAILLIDPASDRIVDANSRACSLLGYSRDELLETSIASIHPEELDHLRVFTERVLELGRDSTNDLSYTTRWGSKIPAEVSASVLEVDGRPLLLASGRDTTERRRVEARLRKAKDAAEAATRAKSEFLANMSHEIRTPLNAIFGYTRLLAEGGAEAETKSGVWLETIDRSGLHLLSLINDVLDLSKIEAGQLKIECVECSPADLIGEVIRTLVARAAEKNLTLDISSSSAIPTTIRTDPTRFRQVLSNLIANAIKFTDEGGITITTRFRSGARKQRLVIEVADTGVGIPEDRLETIFQPFSQVDSSTTRSRDGAGLGLAISQQIARQLGGPLKVKSTPGRGATFTFEIDPGSLTGVRMQSDPMAASRRFLRTGKSERRAASTRIDAKILVVDDGETNRELVRLILERAGAVVETAENGQLAVDLALTESFDVILMDMQMPVLDGYDATRKLRDSGIEAPILALTAHAMKGDKEKCVAAVCSGYLTKPVDHDVLVRTVASVLGASRGAQAQELSSPTQASSPKQESSKQESPTQERKQGSEGAPIVSTLPVDDPEFREIVVKFVDRLQQRVIDMRQTLQRGDLPALEKLAHWLKGSGGTAGFSALTAPTGALEQAAKEGVKKAAEEELSRLEHTAKRVVVDAVRPRPTPTD